ncbi:transposase [Streptomyces aureoversilis]|uniref:Transposase n=1 Tax=Streptomyces aureoversilis TaxID=67277 RepID=A0ABW0A8X5_9ACTN
MDAILYIGRTSLPWRYLPHDLPPWPTACNYSACWQKDRVLEQLNGFLRRLVREREGHDAKPSACVLDSQTIKTSASVPLPRQGRTQASHHRPQTPPGHGRSRPAADRHGHYCEHLRHRRRCLTALPHRRRPPARYQGLVGR